MPKEAVDAPSLQAFKARLDVALGSLVCWLATLHIAGGWNSMSIVVLFNPGHCMIRYKTGYHSLVRALIPSLGIAQLEWAIVNISAEIEVTANPTTEVPYHSNWEVDSLKGVVFQNRMALDIITAPMGGYVP